MKKTKPSELSPNCRSLYYYARSGKYISTLDVILDTGITCVSQEFQRLSKQGYPYQCRRVENRFEYRLV